MAHLVVLIVDDPGDCPDILDAWEAAGVSGITILESSGLGRYKRSGRDDLPLMPSLRDFFESKEVRHRTLFSVVDDENKVDEMVRITRKVIGDLDAENTGFLFVVPVTHAYGLGKSAKK